MYGHRHSELVGIGLRVQAQPNVIIRNVKISKVLADNGDALAVQLSNNVWIDHVEVFSDRDHDKDYYDGSFAPVFLLVFLFNVVLQAWST